MHVHGTGRSVRLTPYQDDTLTRAETANLELELLLCCARSIVDARVAARRDELLKQNLHWPRFLHLATVHHVVPLVRRNLANIGSAQLPSHVTDHLTRAYGAGVKRNLFLTAELLGLLELFAANDIDVIPYKGPVLAETLYGNLCLRQFGDIDILVRRRDVLRARALLCKYGYRLDWPEHPLTPGQEQAHIETKYNYKLVREDGRLAVELHWGISPKYFSFPPDVEWLWENLTELRLAGQTVRSFSWERWLLILCVHGANHCWNRLSWLCDLAELLRRFPDLDWGTLCGEAERFGSRRILHVGLLLAHGCLDAPVPADVYAKAEDDAAACRLANEVFDRCASTRRYIPKVLEVPRFHLRARERFRDRQRYCFAAVVPSVADWGLVSLPEALSFLYYIVRPFRLFHEYSLNPLWRSFKRLVDRRNS